jgi:hypothetical protein
MEVSIILLLLLLLYAYRIDFEIMRILFIGFVMCIRIFVLVMYSPIFANSPSVLSILISGLFLHVGVFMLIWKGRIFFLSFSILYLIVHHASEFIIMTINCYAENQFVRNFAVRYVLGYLILASIGIFHLTKLFVTGLPPVMPRRNRINRRPVQEIVLYADDGINRDNRITYASGLFKGVDGIVCPLCQDDMVIDDPIYKMKCNHNGHIHCYDAWWDKTITHKNQCVYFCKIE